MQASQLRQLQDERVHLLAERDEFRALVSSRDDRVTSLEAECRSRDEALNASQSQVAELTGALTSLKQQLETESHDFRSARVQDTRRYSVLEAKHDNLRDMVESLQNKVDHLNTHSACLESNLREAQIIADDWQSASHRIGIQLESANSKVAGLEVKLRAAQDRANVLQRELDNTKASHALVDGELERTKDELTSVQEELADALRKMEADQLVQSSTLSHITELKADLTSARGQVGTLVASNDGLQRAVTELENTVVTVREELTRAKEDMSLKSAELLETLDTVTALRTSHAQAMSEASSSAREAATLRVIVSELESTLEGLRSQLKHSAAESADICARLVTEEASRRSAECELVATVQERDRLLTDIADKTALLATTTEELKQAQQAHDDARRQMADLKALRESDVAAHLADKSALESRLETSRVEAAGFKTKVEGLSSELSSLSEKFSTVVSERDQLKMAVQEQFARSSQLEGELSVALDDVRDAEEEIEELRIAKTADESSIQSLKDLLARLRQVQLEAVEEVNNKVRESFVPSGDREKAYAVFYNAFR